MKLVDLGLTADDIKAKVSKYMIETYERMDFLCERAKDQYLYDEKGEKYLEGLEKFKQNKAYAREQEDIDHKNHRFDKITVEIYRQLLADIGISL